MPVKEEDERRLLVSASNGDYAAIESLLTIYAPFVHSLKQRIHCPESMREEILQAGFIGLIEAIRRFDLSCGVRLMTYAYPWIIGEMKRVLRADIKHTYMLCSLDDTADEDKRPLVETLAGRPSINNQYIDLHLALSKLPPEERLLIILRYYRDKSQAETACLLKKSQSQISRMERRALDRLGVMLA